MKCIESRKYLDTYVDGELEAGRLIEVETHLTECEPCRSLVFLNRQIKRELLDLGQVSAPDHLRERVIAIPIKSRKKWIYASIAAAPLAAAAMLLVLLNVPFSTDQIGEEPLAAVVDDVVNRHIRDLPMEVEGPDPKEAASWFQGKVDFPVYGQGLKLKNASFEGARLSNVQSNQAAHMRYSIDGHRVTVMIFNPRSVKLVGGTLVNINDRNVFLDRKNGYNVAVLLDRDMAYVFSTDLPKEQLLSIIADFTR